jgi:hypothetical protein
MSLCLRMPDRDLQLRLRVLWNDHSCLSLSVVLAQWLMQGMQLLKIHLQEV